MTERLRLCSYTIKDGMDLDRVDINTANMAILYLVTNEPVQTIYNNIKTNTRNKEFVLVGDKSINWFVQKLIYMSSRP